MEEIWKDIPLLSRYQISSLGRVKSKQRITKCNKGFMNRKERLMTHQLRGKKGYEYACVRLRTDIGVTKTYSIHRLVAQAFIPNPENKPQVNHIDEDKTNNMASNLEWVTPRENLTYGTRMKRVNKLRSVNGYKAKRIVDGEGVIYESVAQASKQLNISRSCLDNVLKGVQKSTKGYTFKYVSEVENNEV